MKIESIKEAVEAVKLSDSKMSQSLALFKKVHNFLKDKIQNDPLKKEKDSYEEADMFGNDIASISNDILRNLENFKRIISSIDSKAESVELVAPSENVAPDISFIEFYKKGNNGKYMLTNIKDATFMNGKLKKNFYVKDLNSNPNKMYDRKNMPTSYMSKVRDARLKARGKGW